jgi:sulfate/thiosulfate transport system permease protein
MKYSFRQPSVLPGFGITLGLTIFYLSLIVLLPLGGLLLRTSTMGWEAFVDTIVDPRVLAAFRLSFGTAFVAAAINAVFGSVVAWVLVRYKFPGRRVVDAMVDLPFAMPTAVSGIAIVTVFAGNGWIGRWLEPLGIQVVYTSVGIVVALTLIGLPFVVRTLQPALEDLETEMEEAAASLGAGRIEVFRRIIFPTVVPALLTGFAMAFARAIGEYGSVIFIAGNMPMRTEITPLLIVIKLEQYDYTGATAIAVVMLVASFAMLLLINLLQWWSRRYQIAAGA